MTELNEKMWRQLQKKKKPRNTVTAEEADLNKTRFHRQYVIADRDATTTNTAGCLPLPQVASRGRVL